MLSNWTSPDFFFVWLTLSQTSPGCLQFKSFENTEAKGEIAHNEQFLLFICPSKTGRTTLSPVAGVVPHSLSREYLQDYASYGYETSWVDRSHQGGVQCTGTITLACLIFELLPFVYFHT